MTTPRRGAAMPRWAVEHWPSVQALVDDVVLRAGPDHGTTAVDDPLAPVDVQDVCPRRAVDHLTFGTTDRFVTDRTIATLRSPGPAATAQTDGVRPVQRDLIDWWSREGRDLPWRRSRDPWAVLVSELMLQQTQVSRVVDRYVRFLDRFPTAAACAGSSVGDVVEEWAGLGYNRRAVFLHRAATACVERHGGRLPDTLDDLLALPGVGPYTARAVLVFAHERDLGLVDTNAGRFVARCLAGRPVPPQAAQSTADAAVPAGWGWTWGQAVFDLGASICRKRAPRCDGCPVRRHCAWARAGFPDPDPIVGSAGISTPQARFDGSDRQGRGRLVDALRAGPVDHERLAAVMGWPRDPGRARQVAATLVRDGLAVRDGDRYRLP